MKQASVFLMLFAALFAGCKEDYPVYSSFCEQNSTSFPPCLRYAVLDAEDKKTVENTFGIKEDPSCPYRVELTKYHMGLCDNPATKVSGSDYKGYVRIEVKNSFKCYYKVQSDFKSDENAAFERVLKYIENERESENKSN